MSLLIPGPNFLYKMERIILLYLNEVKELRLKRALNLLCKNFRKTYNKFNTMNNSPLIPKIILADFSSKFSYSI